MPKKLNSIEIDLMAHTKMEATMCHVGIFNTRKVMYRAWKLAQAEEKRQKNKNKEKK